MCSFIFCWPSLVLTWKVKGGKGRGQTSKALVPVKKETKESRTTRASKVVLKCPLCQKTSEETGALYGSLIKSFHVYSCFAKNTVNTAYSGPTTYIICIGHMTYVIDVIV